MADQDFTAEEWRVIEQFPDYEVSSHGRVRRCVDCWRIHYRSSQPYLAVPAGRFLRPGIDTHGYLLVNLWRDQAKKSFLVSSLVCSAFHGTKPNQSYEVGHYDGNKTNNVSTNLRWLTRLQNHADKERHGTVPRGESAGNSKLKEDQVRAIRKRIIAGDLQKDIAKDFQVCKATIAHIKSGYIWSHIK